MENKKNIQKKKVIIIGAGPCGIVAIKYLHKDNDVICFEAKDSLGGMWYSDCKTEFDIDDLSKNSFYKYYKVLQSSIYENLITNLPKALMTFKGFPHNEETPDFMSQQEYLQYLNDYADTHGLKQFIKYDTFVKSVRLTKNINKENNEFSKKFTIETCSNENFEQKNEIHEADYVVVCTGHFSVPNYPEIKGPKFGGKELHTHYFRIKNLKDFQNKHLLIYGASFSSQDILSIIISNDIKPSKISIIGNPTIMQIINLGSEECAYSSYVKSNYLNLYSSYIEQVDDENQKTLVLKDGQKINDVDYILYATGFQYSLPFFNDEDDIVQFQNEGINRNEVFGPLYMKTFASKHPEVTFIGFISRSIQAQLNMERQCVLVQKYINGDLQLPKNEEMIENFEKEIKECGEARNYFFLTFLKGQNEEEYVKKLQKLANIPLDEEYQNMIKNVFMPVFIQYLFKGNYIEYKKISFKGKIPEKYSPKENYF